MGGVRTSRIHGEGWGSEDGGAVVAVIDKGSRAEGDGGVQPGAAGNDEGIGAESSPATKDTHDTHENVNDHDDTNETEKKPTLRQFIQLPDFGKGSRKIEVTPYSRTVDITGSTTDSGAGTPASFHTPAISFFDLEDDESDAMSFYDSPEEPPQLP